MSRWAVLRSGDIPLVNPRTGEESIMHYGRWRYIKLLWTHKTMPLRCWWNTRQCRVLVTLPCGCQILKNCKQWSACGDCLRRMFRPYMPGATVAGRLLEKEHSQ